MKKASLQLRLFLGIFMFSALPSQAQLDNKYQAENADQSAVCRKRFRQSQYRDDLPTGTNWFYIDPVKRVCLIESETGNVLTDCKHVMIGLFDKEVDTEAGGQILIKEENGALIQYFQAKPNENVERLSLGDKINQ